MWERSGLTTAAFAATHGIAARTLAWWKWRLARAAAAPGGASPAPPRLVEVQIAPPDAPAAAWELRFADGRVLTVQTALTPATLRVLLAARPPGRAR